jgi:hypothetical protein
MTIAGGLLEADTGPAPGSLACFSTCTAGRRARILREFRPFMGAAAVPSEPAFYQGFQGAKGDAA